MFRPANLVSMASLLAAMLLWEYAPWTGSRVAFGALLAGGCIAVSMLATHFLDKK